MVFCFDNNNNNNLLIYLLLTCNVLCYINIFFFILQLSEDVLEQIEDGYIMDPPDNCPNGIYNIMKNCWSLDPESRPDFKTLKALLSKSFGEDMREWNERERERKREGGRDREREGGREGGRDREREGGRRRERKRGREGES